MSLHQGLARKEDHVGFGGNMTKISSQQHVPMHTPLLKSGVSTACFGNPARVRCSTRGAGSKIGSGAPQPTCCLLLEEKYFQRAQHQSAAAKLWRM